MVLLAGYGLWTTSGGVALEEIVVTVMPHTPTPAPELQPAEVAAARDPAAAADVEPLDWSYTVIPDLLLRDEPTLGALARRQLEVATPIELLGEEVEADGYAWVEARIEDGTVGWLIAAGVARASSE